MGVTPFSFGSGDRCAANFSLLFGIYWAYISIQIEIFLD